MSKPTQKELLARYRRALVKLDALTSAHESERDGRRVLTLAPKIVDASLVWMIAHFALDDLDPQQAVLDCCEQDVIEATVRAHEALLVNQASYADPQKWSDSWDRWQETLVARKRATDALIAQRAKMTEKEKERGGTQ